MPYRLSRQEALRILGLDPTAHPADVKHAYRRLARTHHPDAGGEAATFADLQRAYERLSRDSQPDMAPPARRRQPARGPAGSWGDAPSREYSAEEVDLGRIEWSRELPAGSAPFRLDRSLVAVALDRASGSGSVAPLVGRSRGPRSPWNRLVGLLDPELTAHWRVESTAAALSADVRIEVRCRSRGARRRLDRASLPPGWVRQRTASLTTATRTLHPNRRREETATRVALALEAALEQLQWPLESWYTIPSELA